MFNAKAYATVSSTSPLAPTVIARRDPDENDIQIEILFCGVCRSDLHMARNEWSRVWATVYPCAPGHEIVDDVAKDLHMSSRTLQRRLQDAGSNYQQVLDQARHQMARYYLSNSVLELTEAAYLLGYEDANSFARAFRAWEGMPPKHWREAQRSPISPGSSSPN